MPEDAYTIEPIGIVRSDLKSRAGAPLQGGTP